MRGLAIEDGTLRFREDLHEPDPGPDEIVVEVLRAGVCATDLALRKGYMGFSGTPGHEFVGRAVTGRHAGKRVVGEINAGCGRCARCAEGLARHCPTRTVLGILGRPGAFAERMALPEGNLHPLPDPVSTEAAVFAEPLAAAFEIAEQIDLETGARAIVAGDGRLGLLCAHVLASHGLDVTVAGHHPERHALLPAGARHVTGLLDADVAWHALGPADARFDVAVEATGRAEVLGRLIPRLRPRGTCVLKTTSEHGAPIDLAPAVVHEITIVGSRCGPFEPALEALAAGRIPVERFVAERYPLSDGVRAFDRAARPGVLKVLIDPTG